MLVQALGGSAVAVRPLPATLVVVAHPDDEIVGAGSRLALLKHARFVYVTDGAPADGRDAARHGLSVDDYRAVRRRERDAALASCGIAPSQVVDLGCADQQAARRLPELAMQLADLFTAMRPSAVLTQPYEGGHPDHDATAFTVHAAAALLRRAGHAPPELVEMTSYHRGPQGLRAGEFLPAPEVDTGLATVRLDATGRERKRALLACHASQRETLAQFPLDVERFRPAPRYDFRQPPHDGALFYEAHPWGMTGAEFREAAAQAMARCGWEPPP
ncbi:MAG: PIG-L deacetylase family protein [Ramlibacter sp.]